jgi:hypothetical protein
LHRTDALCPTHRRDVDDLQIVINDIKELMVQLAAFLGAGLWPMLNHYCHNAMDVMATRTKLMADNISYFISYLYTMAYFHLLDMLNLVYYDQQNRINPNFAPVRYLTIASLSNTLA